MDFQFNVGWMFGGLAIALVGALIIVFHKQIADNLANGVPSYGHVKLFGLIATIIGLLITANLHIFLLQLIVNLFFKH